VPWPSTLVGEISATSVLGQGTTIRFTLPLESPSA